MMNMKLQAGKDGEELCQGTAAKLQGMLINSFCLSSKAAKSLVLPHRVAVPSSSASAHHHSHIASTPLAHDWVFRNPAIAGDTFQLSALLKSEPTLMARTAYKEGFRTGVWPLLAIEVD